MQIPHGQFDKKDVSDMTYGDKTWTAEFVGLAMVRGPSSNTTPQKHLQASTASAIQHSIIAPCITDRRRNASPSPHSVPMAVTNIHEVRLAARTTSMPALHRHRGGTRTRHRV